MELETMAKFKVGDVCIIIKTRNFPELLGAEVTITEPMQIVNSHFNKAIYYNGYGTDLYHKGVQVCPREENLKLKEFPGELAVMQLFKVKGRESCLA